MKKLVLLLACTFALAAQAEEFRAGTFSAFTESNKELTQLKLESNKISQITESTFYGLNRLKVLILRANLIENLPENLFQYSNQLEEIDLGRNRISNIHKDAFKGTSTS